MTRPVWFTAAVVLLLPMKWGWADDDKPFQISATQEWSMVFGGQELQLPFAVQSSKTIDVRLGWSVAVDNRILGRGERAQTLVAGNTKLTVPIQLPRPDKDVVLAVRVVVQLMDESTLLAQTEMPLWIVPEDPFLNRHDWLVRTKISLFDPVGTTGTLFANSKIPHERLLNVDAISRIDQGVLIIGEGTSLEEFAVLRSMAWEVAARGVAVLLLPPKDGSFPLRDPIGSKEASQLHFCRKDVLRDLDKRFDWRAWPSGDPVVRSFRFTASGDELMASVENGSREWPWVRIDMPKPGSLIIACGFPIVEQWEKGPMPSYLLRRLLEVVGEDSNGKHDENSSKENGS